MSDATVTQQLKSSYEEVPYHSQPHYATHPDCLATAATLLGLRPAPAGACRVLELGCGTGGNLLSMANMLPGSEFVGVDLSPRQIEMGTRLAASVPLPNVKLLALDLMEFDPGLRQFDYIICHGIFSWVPSVVRDKILAICRDHLTDQGVAYISYNTYPGWHIRQPLCDLLRRHDLPDAPLDERARRAKELLKLLIDHLAPDGNAFHRTAKGMAEDLITEPDYYLVHEYLTAVNQPFYFSQFASMVQQYQLQYLGESWYHHPVESLPPEIRQAVRQWTGDDEVRAQEYVDFWQNREFRRSMICRAEVEINRTPRTESLAGLSVVGMACPDAPDGDPYSNAALTFRTRNGKVVTTDTPLIKALLYHLWDAVPHSVPIDDLWRQLEERFAAAGYTPPPGHDRDMMRQVLLRCHQAPTIVLHQHPPKFAARAGERPVASPLARREAELGRQVSNLLHQVVELDMIAQAALPMLDGNHDRQQLLEALANSTTHGEVPVKDHGRQVPFGELPPERRMFHLETMLDHLAQFGLLVDDE